MSFSMGKDSELREWALNHWKIYRSKYTGEVIDFKRSSSENWRNLKLEKPISLIPKSSIISNILNFEIPKLKYEIEQAEEESAKVDSDPGLILELKRKYALLAMIRGFCKGKTEEAAIKALDEHLTSKEPYETFNEVPEQRKTHSQKDNFFKDKNFHELVMRTMEKVGTHWNKVKQNLKNNTLKGETITYKSVSNFEGEMRPQIQYFREGYPEPFEVMESTFKKNLSSYRKQKKLPLPSNKK